jgi:hypothetical protein
MTMNSILSAALALAAPAATPEWAPIAITEGESPTLFFIDRTSLEATPDGGSAWAFMVSTGAAARLHSVRARVHVPSGEAQMRRVPVAERRSAEPGDLG